MDYPVEIKTNVEPDAIDAALATLGLDDSNAEPRAIYFCDSDDGTSLDDLGVVLRVRRDSDSADSTLKFRPLALSRLPSDRRADAEGAGWEFRIEQDWSTAAADPVLSSSLVTDLDLEDADAALSAGLAAGDPTGVFSTDQLILFQAYTGRPLDPHQLRLLGPVRARRWKFELGPRKIAAEEWVVGPELRFLELSDREDDPDRATRTRDKLLRLYADAGIRLSADPHPKTRIAMDWFRSRSTARAPAPPAGGGRG